MKFLLLSITLLISGSAFCQRSERDKLDKATDSLVNEGKALYKSEAASWYGTDVFIAKCNDRLQKLGGGYLSYDTGTGMCNIFYSKKPNPIVIGTMTFKDWKITPDNCVLDTTTRPFNKQERALYDIKEVAVKDVQSNKDSLYRFYKNTGTNFIPMIINGHKRVYILTSPKANNEIIFGNDYLIEIGKDNNITSIRKLHKNIVDATNVADTASKSALHNHLPETGDLITATDICTLMLYEKFTNWSTYYTISKNDISIWDCKKNNLVILTMDAWKRITEDQKTRHQ